MSTLRAWIDADAQHRHSAGDYYTARLAHDQFLLEPDLAVIDYCKRHFGRQTRFFELGFGFGEVSLALALSGFHTVGFESDAGRYAGASALAGALTERGADMANLSLVYGIFPDVLRLDGRDADSESVFVSTNVTSTHMMEAIDHVLRSLRLFDHLIIDISRFGVVRDQAAQQALVAKLRDLGFQEVARVYSSGETDMWHFRRGASGETGTG